jgi:ribose transport system permease protein
MANEEKKPTETPAVSEAPAEGVNSLPTRASAFKGGMKKVGGWLSLSWKKAAYVYIFIVMMLVYMVVLGFENFQWGLVSNLFSQASVVGIIALGMGLIIITGDIDLSVGSNFAFTGGIAMLAYKAVVAPCADKTTGAVPASAAGWGMVVAFLVCLGVGGVAGFLNGFLVGKIRIPAFIATLGTMLIYRSLCQYILKSLPYTGSQQQTYSVYNYSTTNSASPFYVLGNYDIFGNHQGDLIIPITVVIFFVVVALVYFVATFTKAGRKVYAVGSNAKGASLAGINVPWTRVAVFTIAGVLVGLAAFIHMGIYGSMESSTAGQSYELYAIAGCIIGGIAMTGGKGNIIGILFGTVSFQIIDKIINAWGLNPLINNTFKGVILLIAVLLQLIQINSLKDFGKNFKEFCQKMGKKLSFRSPDDKPGSDEPKTK